MVTKGMECPVEMQTYDLSGEGQQTRGYTGDAPAFLIFVVNVNARSGQGWAKEISFY